MRSNRNGRRSFQAGVKSAVELAESYRDKPLDERIRLLEGHVRAAQLERQLHLMEHASLVFGTVGATVDLVGEHPVHDDGEIWDEVGLHAAGSPGLRLLPRSEEDLRRGRQIGRFLCQENEFALGAHEARINYIVGTGVEWSVSKADPEVADEVQERVAERLEAFLERERWALSEQEAVKRADRDGEAIFRLFPDPMGPLAVRFAEPEDIRSPRSPNRHTVLGVEVVPNDVQTVEAYWFATPDGLDASRVSRLAPSGLPNVVHVKMNVDRNARRGWPLMWPVRRNLTRAEKLLRAMGFVAALQASIALIRKHENATAAQVRSFLDENRDLLVTDRSTGKDTRMQGIQPGTVIDTGPGVTYEAPISSVNAAANVTVLQAELRAAAARLQMPEFLFTADASNANFASTQVAESPWVRQVERLQSLFRIHFEEVIQAALRHEVLFGRLIEEDLLQTKLQAEFPGLEVRDKLNEAQQHQLEHEEGVISIRTWRGRVGLDHEEEERNLAEEREAAMARGLTGPLGHDEDEDEDDAETSAEDETEAPTPPQATDEEEG